jgi:hypothetical protein
MYLCRLEAAYNAVTACETVRGSMEGRSLESPHMHLEVCSAGRKS